MARYVLPAVGAVVGFIYGGPAGASLGWTLGSAGGSLIDPQVIKGPGVGDIAQQTSQEGVPRPIVFGMSQPIAGNVIATSAPRIEKRKQSGKGGPKVETESVFRTYAIRICEGPIDAVIRVWKNNQLVYDARAITEQDDPETPWGTLAKRIAENGAFLNKARLFLGSYDQNPSPDLEAVFGVGTTPAHRGTAYLVMADDDLTDMRGAIPQFTFQVSRGGHASIIEVYDVPGAYTWTRRNNLLSADVTIVGAGGGAASGNGGPNTLGYGGGGAGGGFMSFSLDASLLSSSTYSVTVGAGGIGGAGVLARTAGRTGNFGVGGGTSEFGSWGRCLGGARGTPSSASGPGAAQGGFAEVLGSGHTSLVTEQGGGAPYNSANTPNSRTRSGAGGGNAGNGSGQAGGVTSNNGDPYYGGNGGAGSPASFNANAASGQDGFEYGGGGGAGGNCGCTSPNNDLYLSGDGGRGADGVVVVVSHIGSTHTSDILSAICDRAGMDPGSYDVSQIDGEVEGLTITNAYPAYTALQALSQASFFAPSYYDGVLHFIPGGGNAVATITESDIVEDGGSSDIEQAMREDSIAVPRVMHLLYYDIQGGLATDKQTSERAGIRRALGEQTLQSAVIMHADQAARAVAINHKVAIEELKGEVKFRLPDSWLRLVPTNPVILQWQGSSKRLRITKAEILDGYQQYELYHDRQSSYTSEVEGIPAGPQTPPPSNIVGPTLIQPLDIHILRDLDDNAGLLYYVAASGTMPAWAGALIELSIDGGMNYIDDRSTTVQAVMGTLSDGLADHPQEFPDFVNTLSVSIATPGASFDETDLTGLLNRLNLAIVGDEIIQFAQADEATEGEWNLSLLLRGRFGTSSQEHSQGTRFVLLSTAALGIIPASLVDIGRTLTFRATSFGETEDSATVVSMIYTGRSQIERETGYVSARMDGSNVVVTWQGVGRIGSGAQVAHGTRFSDYRVTLEGSGIGETPIVVDTSNQFLTQDVTALTRPIHVSVSQVNSLTGAGPSVDVFV